MPSLQLTAGQTARFPSGAEIYDGIMRLINPELTLQSLPHLDERYRDESEDERRARLWGYEEDFKMYERAFARWANGVRGAVDALKHAALSAAETIHRSKEVEALGAIEQSFTQLP